jgi:hypothetical protein
MLSPTELLRAEGSIQFGLPWRDLEEAKGLIIFIADKDFLFFVGLGDGWLMFARGDDMLRLPLRELVKLGRAVRREIHVIVGWTRTHMLLSASGFGSGGEGLNCECDTPPYEPPRALIDWARRQGLAPVTEYESEEAFYARVFVALGSMENKLENVRDPSCFWNVRYEGNKVIQRTPKREEDLHSIVESVLSDHLFLSAIDVFPEHATSVGRLDFLLVGNVADGKRGKVCVEFKNTHSPDFMRGLTHQLPAYMAATGVEVGAYCGLDFSGPWLKAPTRPFKRTAEITVAIRSLGNQRRQYPIQYFEYHLGKNPSASHL